MRRWKRQSVSQACANVGMEACLCRGPWQCGVTPKWCYWVDHWAHSTIKTWNIIHIPGNFSLPDMQTTSTGKFSDICHAHVLLLHPYNDISTQGMWKAFTSGCIDSRLKAWALHTIVLNFVASSVCCGVKAWILTVSPVPKTITSYSSSMLYQRLSRRSLLAKEMKVYWRKVCRRVHKSRGCRLPFSVSIDSIGVRYYLIIVGIYWLMEYTVHSVTGEDDQRWPW